MEEILYRELSLRANTANENDRTVEASLSSTDPYLRAYGYEVLSHDSNAIDLTRAASGLPLLFSHDPEQPIGIIENVRIAGTKLKGLLRFGHSAKAQELWKDVQAGILKNMSVGYIVDDLKQTGERDGYPEFTATKWTPLEASLVSIPADPSVGIGRALFGKTLSLRGTEMDKQITDITLSDNSVEKERSRVKDILAIGEMYPQLRDEAVRYAAEGKSLEEFRAVALKRINTTQVFDTNNPPSEIGMSARELGQYSLRKLILAQLDPRRYGKEAGLELAASDEHARMTGREPRGIYVPHDVLVRTTLTAGTAAQGGNLVGTDHLAQNFVELLRNALVVGQLGAMQLDGLVGNVSIPTQTGASDPYWIAEGGAITAESTPNFGSIPLTPKTVASYVSASRKLMLQSSPQIEQLLRNDLALTIATEIDRVAINGSGAGAEPTGILNTSGIGDVAGGANGAAPTWANIVALESDLATANADVGALAYLTNAAARAKLKTTLKNPTYGDEYIWETNPLEAPVGVINGNKAAVSNNVPSNLTKGTGTNLSAIIFGNFSDLIIGMWGGLDLKVDEVTLGTSGGLVIRVFQDIDIGVRHAGSFSAMQDAITT